MDEEMSDPKIISTAMGMTGDTPPAPPVVSVIVDGAVVQHVKFGETLERYIGLNLPEIQAAVIQAMQADADAIADLKRGSFVTLPGTHHTVKEVLDWCDANGLENPILERGPDDLIRGRARRK
jgi:hypothetical protein